MLKWWCFGKDFSKDFHCCDREHEIEMTVGYVRMDCGGLLSWCGGKLKMNGTIFECFLSFCSVAVEEILPEPLKWVNWVVLTTVGQFELN